MTIVQGRGNAINMIVLVSALVLATLLLLQTGVEGKNHNVGGTKNWDYPAVADMGYYDKWAAQQTFLPGDTLTFTYTPTEHDTTIVTATEYTSCVMSTGKKYTTGTDVVTLTKAGTYYFYCSIMGHCEMGMKMKVTVAAAVTPIVAPALAPAPAPVPVKAPAPTPELAPVPSPELAPVPSPELAPAPVGVPDVAPTPGVTVFVPVAAPAPEVSSASALSLGFRLLSAGVAVAAVFVF